MQGNVRLAIQEQMLHWLSSTVPVSFKLDTHLADYVVVIRSVRLASGAAIYLVCIDVLLEGPPHVCVEQSALVGVVDVKGVADIWAAQPLAVGLIRHEIHKHKRPAS